jgi:precorrin-6A/cobalt-precorrin-6A reductase
MRILILGGTLQASRLAAALAERTDIDAILSYAGRTSDPRPQPIPSRIGGFGGVSGLSQYLRETEIDLLIDATHPFAARISANAFAASIGTGVPLVCFARPPWTPGAGDDWIEVADNAAVLAALGAAPRRVFLTIGRLGVADFKHGVAHHYLIRTIDPPPADDLPPDHRLILARGDFSLDDEIALMREADIDVLVTKNSGGSATYAKIAAARSLHLPVVMVTPPARPDVPTVHSLEACLEAIERHMSADPRAHGSTASIGTDRRV